MKMFAMNGIQMKHYLSSGAQKMMRFNTEKIEASTSGLHYASVYILKAAVLPTL